MRSPGSARYLDSPRHKQASVLFLCHHGLDGAQQQLAMNRYMRALDAPLTSASPLLRLLESRCGEPDSHRNNGEPHEETLCQLRGMQPSFARIGHLLQRPLDRDEAGQRDKHSSSASGYRHVHNATATHGRAVSFRNRLDVSRATTFQAPCGSPRPFRRVNSRRFATCWPATARNRSPKNSPAVSTPCTLT